MKNVEETESEVMQYEACFKYRCFLCGVAIKTDPYWKHYKDYGNCCSSCSGRVGAKLTNKLYEKKIYESFPDNNA